MALMPTDQNQSGDSNVVQFREGRIPARQTYGDAFYRQLKERNHPMIEDTDTAETARIKSIITSDEGKKFRTLAFYVSFETTNSPEQFQAIVRSFLEDAGPGNGA
jgi:hypothetical protein